MEIYLIRHGETTGDIENRYGGDYDDDLSEKGQDEAKELADKLISSGIQLILCSPRIRAQQTAKSLANKLNCEIKNIQDLRERNQNGILTGMVRDEAKEKYPELTEKVKDYHNQIEGAEGYGDFVIRIKKAFEEIKAIKDYETIAVVTHGGPIRVFFREILKAGEIEIGDCAYVILEIENDNFIIKELDGITLVDKK